MSILIKGMEMPDLGNETIIRIKPDGSILDQYGHHLDCTAIPVPPHGRLGDLNILEQKINRLRIKAMLEREDANPYWSCLDAILQTPTITEAEEGK